MVVITEQKHFYFDCYFSKDVDKSFKHEIESVIKRNESVGKHKIKNETYQLLFKYKHGNDIHKHLK